MNKKFPVEAGEFKQWLGDTRHALQKQLPTNVPCASCTACCTSYYFIHIRPDEKKTLDRIPKELLFPAPGLPEGHQVLGYDKNGHCPMLKINRCSIYDDRPQTCRSYDCRVFSATGLPAGDERKQLVNQQVERWRFTWSASGDRKLYNTVRKSARFLFKNREKFPQGFIPSNTTQLAVLAIRVYPFFNSQIRKMNKTSFIQQIVNHVRQSRTKYPDNFSV